MNPISPLRGIDDPVRTQEQAEIEIAERKALIEAGRQERIANETAMALATARPVFIVVWTALNEVSYVDSFKSAYDAQEMVIDVENGEYRSFTDSEYAYTLIVENGTVRAEKWDIVALCREDAEDRAAERSHNNSLRAGREKL